MKFNTLALSVAATLNATAPSVQAEITDADSQEFERVVITGQKIDRTLQETPTSVAVVTDDEIQNQNILNISDVFSRIPNVSGDLRQGFSIRGIDAFNVSGGGNSFLTSVYFDGAPLPYRVIRNGGLSVWDLSQIEVFRGPQSTLQGRNALAGAVIMRSQDPTYEWGGKTRLTLGEYGQQEFAVAGGGALLDDLLAFRISYEDRNYDGSIKNTTLNDRSDYEESETLRSKILFEPSDNVKALFTFTNTKSDLGPQWALFEYGEGSALDREVWTNTPIWEGTDTDIYTLELDWQINDLWSLTSVTTKNESEYGYLWDGDMTPEQVTLDNTYTKVDDTFSQEFRFVFQGDTLEAVFGLYTSTLDVEDKAAGERLISLADVGIPDLATLLGAPAEFGGFGLPASVVAMVVPLYPDIDPIQLGLGSSTQQEVTTSAVYADFTYAITEQLDLLAGLRYDYEEQTNSADNLYTINNQLPDPTNEAYVASGLSPVITGINAALNSLASSASGVEPASNADFDVFLPKLGLSYHFDDNLTTNFIYQQGYRSGGVGTNITQSKLYTYDPEYTDNYELSLRSVWLDGSLMLNASAFLTKWKDQQISVQYSTARYDIETVNAGKSEIKGFEAELFYYPSKQMSVTAGIGYAKSEFTEFDFTVPATGEVKDFAGKEFQDAPTWTANLAVNYKFESGLYANVNANYADDSPAYLDPANILPEAEYARNPNPTNDSRVLVNAQVGYEWENYTLRFDVTNLLDEEYISTFFSDGDATDHAQNYGQHQLGRPRHASVSLLVQF